MGKGRKIFEIIKQIIRWIWRVILSFLFIAGIFFQAPLKLLILVGIFLSACTILPLRYRKWFWACVGIVVFALILWIFLPDKDGDWKPYTFDKELAALEAKRQIPDEQNAAVIYNRLIADYNESSFDPNFLEDEEIDDKTMGTYWHSKDYPQVAEWIEGHKETIDKLMQASKLEKCKFDITSKSLILSDTKRPSAFRRWAYLLSRASNNDIAEGRTAEGLEKIYRIPQMGNHLCQQPTIVEILVGITAKAVAIDRLKKYAINGNAEKKQLDAIEQFIKKIEYNWQADLPRVLDYEKLGMKDMCSLLYETNTKEEIRLNRAPQKTIMALSPTECDEELLTNYFLRKLTRANTITYWFFVPANPQELSKTIDTAYQRIYDMAEPDFDWNKPPKMFSPYSFKLNYKQLIEMLIFIVEPTYRGVHNLYLHGNSEKNGALLLIALRRYKDKNGSWPENLDEIKGLTNEENFIDPANGQAFVYKLVDDGFVLYSKGKNGIDNGGIGYSGDKAKEDDIYIWPLYRDRKKLSMQTPADANDTRQD